VAIVVQTEPESANLSYNLMKLAYRQRSFGPRRCIWDPGITPSSLAALSESRVITTRLHYKSGLIREITNSQRRCSVSGSLTGNTSGICPECGNAVARDGAATPPAAH